MHRRLHSWMLASLLLATGAGNAWCDAIISFQSRDLWNTATENRVLTDFNVVPDGGWMVFANASGYQVNGSQFVGYQNANTYLGYISDVPAGGIYDFGTDAVFRTVDRGGWSPSDQVPWIMVTLPLSTHRALVIWYYHRGAGMMITIGSSGIASLSETGPRPVSLL